MNELTDDLLMTPAELAAYHEMERKQQFEQRVKMTIEAIIKDMKMQSSKRPFEYKFEDGLFDKYSYLDDPEIFRTIKEMFATKGWELSRLSVPFGIGLKEMLPVASAPCREQ